MIVIEKNQGQKIDYEVNKQKITFDDDLTINLAKRQEDWDVHIDVCYDADDALVIGAAAGRRYVAELDIPAREYEQGEPSGEDDTAPVVPLPLDMEKVTLSLWSIE